MEFWDIIGKAQQADLDANAAKVQAEAEQRRLNMAQQVAGQSMSMSELLKKLEGGDQDTMPTIQLKSNAEVRPDAPINTRPQFPAPPKGPTGAGP